MTTKNEENWMMHYNELKAYVAVHHHFPVRHTTLNNWIRYQRKRIKAGMLPEEQMRFVRGTGCKQVLGGAYGREKEEM